MFGETFYHQGIRKLVIAFGTLFNEIILVRHNESNEEIDRIRVPIVYAPKQKYIIRNTQDPQNTQQVAVVYPRMSFEIVGLDKDMTRKLTSTTYNTSQKDENNYNIQYVPVPYNVGINLYIIGKNSDDVIQLVERIIPQFRPQYEFTLLMIPELNLKDDVALELEGAKFDDSYDGQFDDRRTIVWTLKFNAKILLYGRITKQGIIRKVQTDILIPEGSITPQSIAEASRSARITVEPDPIDASPTDDFGFSTSIEEFEDGLKYNPVTGQDEPV